MHSYRRSLLLFALIVASTGTSVRAHDPRELTMTATVRPTQLDLVVTMAATTAGRVLDPSAESPPRITSASFPGLRARLAAAGARLFTLTSTRTAHLLPLRTVSVTLTEENDIEFKLLFPRPAAGPLHFHATILTLLGEGHGGILECTDTVGHHLNWDQLTSEKPALTVTVPAP